jgi:hypothetical protein
MPDSWTTLVTLLLLTAVSSAQETHSHHAPEQLGRVSFAISCPPSVQEHFNRGVALLHSFAYSAAENAFRGVAERDPRCAIAHWGIAISYFHQLWDPPLVPTTIPIAQKEIQLAQQIRAGTERERQFIHALGFIYQDADMVPYQTRASNYERAMTDLASKNRKDVEAQVFYAVALLANASPTDKTHTKQKQAADLLEPLDRTFPQHPGIPHYLIHAYDNAELAPRGLSAARAYSQVAPSAPHALHMPSHIFTRLGLWDDSIPANLAAREAAHQQSDTGEELHAMDYLVYACLQVKRESDAAQIIRELKNMPKLDETDFKVAYASTAMPVRYAVEKAATGGRRLYYSADRSPAARCRNRGVGSRPRTRPQRTGCGSPQGTCSATGGSNGSFAHWQRILGHSDRHSSPRGRGMVSSGRSQAKRGRNDDAPSGGRRRRNRETSGHSGTNCSGP